MTTQTPKRARKNSRKRSQRRRVTMPTAEFRQAIYTRHSNAPREQCFRRNGRNGRNASEISSRTLDEENRRIQSVLSTEDPAEVYDWRNGQIVLEVLLQDGCEFENDTPLIRNHNSWNIDEVVGSVVSHAIEGGRTKQTTGWLQFLPAGDDIVDRTWHRVAGQALRRVSVGYVYGRADYETIEPGETKRVKGRTFTAPKNRSLRIVTRWTLLEVSLVVVPADAKAQMRASGTRQPDSPEFSDDSPQDSESLPTARAMKKFLSFLHARGMARSIKTIEDAIEWACDGNLSQTAIRAAAAIAEQEAIDFFAEDATAKTRSRNAPSRRQRPTGDEPPEDLNLDVEGGNGEGGTATLTRSRRQTQVANPDDDGQGGHEPQDNPRGGRRRRRGLMETGQQGGFDDPQQILQGERDRIAAIEDLAADFGEAIPESMVREARIEGWSIEDTHREFVEHLRGRRELFGGSAPAGQARGMGDITREVLQAAMLTKSDINISPDDEVLRHDCMRNLGRSREFNIGWLVNQPAQGQARDRIERNFDIVDQRGLRNLSMMQAAELMVELETGERNFDREDILERAYTSGGYAEVYGATIHLELLRSYAMTPNTYSRVARVVDVGDFREQKSADMGVVERLSKQGRQGGEARNLNLDDPALVSLLIDRYAGKLQISDQMIIDDIIGVTGMIPSEIGMMCTQMIDDLVWAQILDTANLSDGRQRYNLTDGNLVTGSAFNEAVLTQLGSALKVQKVQGRRIRITEGILAAGVGQIPAVRKQMNSQNASDGTQQSNPHRSTYQVVEENAIDLGVDNPANNDQAIAGRPGSIFAFASGLGSKQSVTAAFRRGTNRGPMTRRYQLTQGQWGMGWDVYMDMGAAFQRRIGTVEVQIS